MSERADDLGIPIKPVRSIEEAAATARRAEPGNAPAPSDGKDQPRSDHEPVPTPLLSRGPDRPQPGAGPAHPPASPRVPDLSRPVAQPISPAPSAIFGRQTADEFIVRPADAVEARKLIVGQGISLSGDIGSCDRLVVEGSVQANLQNCQHMMIAANGLFEGNAAIDDAEIHGRFEGDLVVHKRLLIRASGHASGTITYGEIEIELGGRISGTIQAARG